jgi:hypothetical protein
VRTDRVSIEYRRWLREVALAVTSDDPVGALGAALDGRRTGSGMEAAVRT